jgi:hypothetical protein
MLGSSRVQNLLIALVMFVALVSAQEPVEAVYLQGRIKEIPERKAGKLDPSDPEVLRFTWDKGSWKAPYTQIKTIYLSMTRQSVMIEVFGVPGARRKVLMSLVFTDEQGNSRNGVFILSGASNHGLLQTLEKRSGRQAVYESAEARKAVGAPP